MLETVVTTGWENSLSIIFGAIVFCGLMLQPLDSTNIRRTSLICTTCALFMAGHAKIMISLAESDIGNHTWNGTFAVSSAVFGYSMLYTSTALSRFSKTVRDKFFSDFFDPRQSIWITAYIMLLGLGAILGLSKPQSPDYFGGGILCAIAAVMFYKLLRQLHNRDILLEEMGGIVSSSCKDSSQ